MMQEMVASLCLNLLMLTGNFHYDHNQKTVFNKTIKKAYNQIKLIFSDKIMLNS